GRGRCAARPGARRAGGVRPAVGTAWPGVRGRPGRVRPWRRGRCPPGGPSSGSWPSGSSSTRTVASSGGLPSPDVVAEVVEEIGEAVQRAAHLRKVQRLGRAEAFRPLPGGVAEQRGGG